MFTKQKIRYINNEDNLIELIISDDSLLSYPSHTHSSIVTIGFVLDGDIDMHINNTFHRYRKNDVFTILPNTLHSMKVQNPYSLLTLCINKDFHQNAKKDELRLAALHILLYAFDLDYLNKAQYLRIIDHIISFTVYEITNKLVEVNQLKAQLEQLPEGKLSVDEMACVAYTSKYHFIRVFKENVGLTPHQYQLQNRIRKAQKLLCQNFSLTKVAFATGFCDQSHFIKRFEKVVGLTPTPYKQSCITLHQKRYQMSAGMNFANK